MSAAAQPAARPQLPSTSRRVRARLPDPARSSSTASRSRTSTTRPRARSRAPCIDAIARYYSARSRERAPRRAHAQRARDRRLRRRARRRCAASSTPRRREEIVFTRGTTEAHQPRRAEPRRAALEPGRRDPDHRRWSTTRTSCRGSCSASRPARSSSSRRSRDAGELDRRGVRRACSAPRTKIVALAHVSNALGTVEPGRRAHRRRRMRAARVVLRRRRAGRAAHARRRAGARLRLLRVLGPQDVRADRHRRAVRQARAARGDAAVAGRRRHDPHGHVRRRRPTTRCRTSSRRARRTSRAPSASAPRSTTSKRIGFDAHRRARARAARATRPSAARRDPGRADHRHGARQGGGAVVRDRRAFIRTTSARSSTARASRSARGITARCR